jgi:hypothetical protein
MKRADEINARLGDIQEAIGRLRAEETTLREERSVLVDDLDRAEMKRRGHVTHVRRVTEKWASAYVCPFCQTKCASSQERKDFPNEQNYEYHCGNIGAIK